jgi:hypothetical protein
MSYLDGNPQRREREKAKMLDPLSWPMWPWLPLKRQVDGRIEFGAMYADDTDDGKPVRVFVRAGREVGREDQFPDHDGLLDAGWVVD